MRNPFTWILYAFNTPSAFPSDWKAWLTNQVGHLSIVGALPALLGAYYAQTLVILLADHGGPVWPAVAAQWMILVLVALLYALWEWAQYHWKGASDADCLADWSFVMLGHLVAATLNPVLAVILVTLLASGARSRARQETFYF